MCVYTWAKMRAIICGVKLLIENASKASFSTFLGSKDQQPNALRMYVL